MTLTSRDAVARVGRRVRERLARGWRRATHSPREDEVMPAHYTSLLVFEDRNYPGHCPDCGEDNEPGSRVCEVCGSQIPTTRIPADADIGWIVDG